MSRWLRPTEQVFLGIGRDALGWLAPARGKAGGQQQLAIPAASLDAPDWPTLLNELLASVRAGQARAELHVTVADPRCRQWLTTPPAGLRQFNELQALAGLRFEELFRLPLADWALAADWSAQAPFVCAALPQALVDALHAVAPAHRLKLRSVQPQSVRLLNRLPLTQADATIDTAWACAFRPEGFTALLLQAGQPADWRQHWCNTPMKAADVLERLRAQALVAERPMPQRLFAAGDAPDFAGQAQVQVQVQVRHSSARNTDLRLPTRGVLALAACGVGA